MNGTKRSDIKIGIAVLIVQKQDQRTGKLTEGIVKKILTNSPEDWYQRYKQLFG